MIGRSLRNRYRIVNYLGQGGFGKTFLAEDLDKPGKPSCAVKQLKPQSSNPKTLQKVRELFYKEAQVLDRLGKHHPQIPELLARFEENHEFYLVQEYIDGYPLDKVLNPAKPWNEDQVITLLSQVLKILSFVHQENVIHRDIKPSNLILRRQDQKYVLIDFGAVKEIVSTRAINNSGETSLTIVGTLGYMPIEQEAGRPEFSSDIYALGVVCIQALTGQHPQTLGKDSNTGELIWSNQISVSPGLATILNKMVRYDFRQRYQTADEVLSQVNNLISSNCSVGGKTQALPSPKVIPARSHVSFGKFVKFLSWIAVVFMILFLINAVDPSLKKKFVDYFQTKQLQAPEIPSESSSPSIEQEQPPVDLPSVPTQKGTPVVDLNSAVGVDYNQLQDLMKEGRWRESDRATKKIMLKIAGREQQDFIDTNSMNKFPCEDLHTINQLWTNYSEGHFGFSVQRSILLKIDPKLNGFNVNVSPEIYVFFGETVGWHKGNSWKKYDDLDFTLNAPLGHLPVRGIVGVEGFKGVWYAYGLFPRMKACGI